MTKQVLIVGGSSFIAVNLIERFLKESWQVIVYGRNKPALESRGLTFISGELSEINSKLSFLSDSKIDNAIYLINNIPVNSNAVNYEACLSGNRAAIDFLFTLVKRVVYFSSGGRIYKTSPEPHKETDELSPTCAYGKSKVELEEYVIKCSAIAQKEYLIIRPSNPYGKYQKLYSNQGLIAITLGKIKRREEIEIWGTGSEVRDYIYIDDFVSAFYALFNCINLPYNIFNIGSGYGVSTIKIIETILELTDSSDIKKKYIDIHRSLIPSNILCNQRLIDVIGPYSITPLTEGISAFIKSTMKS
ncbi:NAD-dependent epimerase/dehydratase family protein [Enterobacter asburiae]|uniref:NAD-dependent epimerase/dehydratase family protein n=1 Tax=Enterobacter asburiae TaxID=61645 RepID=UPI00192CCD9C|nr:NAD-dependent epimerase/dehydratase family protein [Enterobacter asburiae]MBL5942786.1 NAD-dependent epimerase/dehydratase family protein [Enterobacter asburiae]MBL5951692.1 NAD-dependent epimerase/dehydratase family protein [Enterobacter asburiae]